MADRASLEVSLGKRSGGRRRASQEPARILLMGDFSGNTEPAAPLTPRKIDFDTFDATIAAWSPAVEFGDSLPFLPGTRLDIGSIDDFHPDSLARTLPIFEVMRDLANRLANSATRDKALADLAELTGDEPAAPAETEAAVDDAAAEDDSDVVQRLLGAPASGTAQTPAQQKVAALIQNALGSAATVTPSVSAERGRARIDDMRTAAMRAVLSFPQLRDLERAWRSAEWLIQRLDDETAEIFLLDLSQDRLVAHLNENADHLDQSALHRVFSEPESGAAWDLLVGDYTFSFDAPDLLLLTTIGALAGTAGVPFVAHGDLSLCGCASPEQIEAPWDWSLPDNEVAELWATVRAHPAAHWLGLAAPRFLLRQPYGPETDPIDAFDFAELPVRPLTEHFLWGNPAIAAASVFARATTGYPSVLSAADLKIEDLPVALYDDGTGQALQPPVETLISDRSREQIEASGLVALLGHRNANYVQCPGLFSISAEAVSFLR